jgi:hypothetical protein
MKKPTPRSLALEIGKLTVGAFASLAGVVIFYLSVSDAAAAGSDYETQIGNVNKVQWTLHTSASTYPGLSMLVCGICLLIEVGRRDPTMDLSAWRISLAWPAINSSLMLVALYKDGLSILLANATQTVGLMLIKRDTSSIERAPKKKKTRPYFTWFVHGTGHLCVLFAVLPVFVAMTRDVHWHVVLTSALYLTAVAAWAAFREVPGVELACEAVNTLFVPWLMWGLFSIQKPHGLPTVATSGAV